MGIYIPGMKMPPKGKRLFVAVNGCGDVYLITSGAEIITKYQPSVKAVELPPHGRLIDADAIMDGWMNLREATKYGNKTKEELEHSYSTMMMYEIADAIEDAPTIIPADPEGGAVG